MTIQVIGRPDQPASPACTPDSEQVALTWTQPTNDNGAPILGYELEHDVGGNESTGNSTNLTWDGLTNATEYRFRLAARNEAGVGPFSEWSLPCTPDIEPERPAPPQVTHGDGVLRVSWSAPENNGSTIEGYKLRIVGGETIEVLGGVLEHDWEPLQNGLDFTFQVAAFNAKGDSVFSTPSLPEHPSTTPDAPTVQATTRAGLIGANASGTLQVNWTPVPVANDGGDTILHYLIERRPNGGTPPQALGANANSYIWSGLPNGVTYEFRVTAVNRDGEGAPSAWSPALKACTVPDAPSVDTAVAGDRMATVTFSQPADNGGCDITEYRVRRLGSTGPGVLESHPPSPVTISDLDNGDSVAFEVQAINTLGASNWVATNAVVPKGAPICPTGYRVTDIGPNGTSFAWDAANFNGGDNNRYEWTGSSGEPHDVGLGLTHQVGKWSEGTFTLSLAAVNEVGSDSCGSVTFSTCPDVPPAPPTPSISVNQAARSFTISNIDLPTINCLSQPEVSGEYDIGTLRMRTEQLANPSGLVTDPLDLALTAASFSLGVSTPLPAGWEGRMRFRVCYESGPCGAFTSWLNAEIDPVVTLTQGNTAARNGCRNGPCEDLVVDVAGFSPFQTVTIVSEASSDPNNWCGNWTVTTDANGSAHAEEHCHWGYHGESVWVFANGIRSNTVVWD